MNTHRSFYGATRGKDGVKCKAITMNPQTSILPPIPTIYLLRSRKDGTALTVLGRPPSSKYLTPSDTPFSAAKSPVNKCYSLGFIHKEDAELVRKTTSAKSKIVFAPDCDDMFSIVTMERKININELPMFIHEMSFQMFLDLPLKSQIDIGFVHQVLEVNSDDIVMEVQTLDGLHIL